MKILKNKKTVGLLITTGCLAVVVAIALIFYLSNPVKQVELPEFVDKTIQDVMSWKDANELTDTQVLYEYEYNEEKEKDTVLSQSLDAGTKIKDEDAVTFVISKGYDPDLVVALPENMDSMTEQELTAFFEENRFDDVTFEYVTSDEVDAGKFMGINIESDSAKRSEMIIIQISVGTESVGVDVPMPDFAGESKSAVEAWAAVNNMKVTYSTAFSDTVASGKVISQSPEDGTIVQTGGTVSVTISAGKAVKLEDLSGKTKEQVEAWAKENGVKVEFIEYYAQKTEEGKVISTSPSSGNVSENTTIKVYISLGYVKMIDFTGKKEADVKKWVETVNKSINEKSSHISYKIVKSETNEEDAGTILKTNPAKDAKVEFSTVITVTVAAEKTAEVVSKSNITVAELKTYVESLDMVLGKATASSYSDTIAKDKVIKSDSGTLKTGTEINYTVSLGAYSPTASSFDGKTKSEVTSTISTANASGAGWSTSFTEEFSSTVASGKTFGCTISNKTVTCKISKGAGVTVPNYVSENRKPCSTDSCTVDNLKVTMKYEYNSAASGTVIKQSLTAGTIVASGTSITVTVSKGPEPTPTPSPSPSPSPTPTPENTTATIPDRLDIVSCNNDASIDAMKACVVNVLTSAGFKSENINFTELSGTTDNPNSYVGVIKSVSPDYGSTVSISSIITVTYYNK